MLRSLPFLAVLSAASLAQQSERTASILRDKVEPRWLPGGDAFWYRNDLGDGKKEFVMVDAIRGERRVIAEA
ncbi:MAG: dap4 3, partial [Chthoniobacter sp.]|nr:dap4 3 [Chthoniobacter sp.]